MAYINGLYIYWGYTNSTKRLRWFHGSTRCPVTHPFIWVWVGVGTVNIYKNTIGNGAMDTGTPPGRGHIKSSQLLD